MAHSAPAEAAVASQRAALLTKPNQKAVEALQKAYPSEPATNPLYSDVEISSWTKLFERDRASLRSLAGTINGYADTVKNHASSEQEVIDAWRNAAHLWISATVPSPSWLPGYVVGARCADPPIIPEFPSPVTESHQDRLPSPSIVLNYRRLYSNYDESHTVLYAEGHRILLQIFEPKFSFPLSGHFDFLDGQSGIGVYRFSSQGFASFSGLMFEPVQFDLHLPSRWADKSRLLRAVQALSYSGGLVIFPGGFSPARFNATGSAARQISGREAVFEQAVIINVTRIRR
jgi:hypothetical protein